MSEAETQLILLESISDEVRETNRRTYCFPLYGFPVQTFWAYTAALLRFELRVPFHHIAVQADQMLSFIVLEHLVYCASSNV